MPALPTDSFLSALISPNNTANLTSSVVANDTVNLPWKVVCAWPVSGQYGPGSRIL